MEQGSLPERYLSRSVIKHIRRLNPKLSVSAAVGNDYANLHGSVSADGHRRYAVDCMGESDE